ncbi:MAG: hypothetical protein ABI459_06895, partial [Deltaproteobacteria bacterium]
NVTRNHSILWISVRFRKAGREACSPPFTVQKSALKISLRCRKMHRKLQMWCRKMHHKIRQSGLLGPRKFTVQKNAHNLPKTKRPHERKAERIIEDGQESSVVRPADIHARTLLDGFNQGHRHHTHSAPQLRQIKLNTDIQKRSQHCKTTLKTITRQG